MSKSSFLQGHHWTCKSCGFMHVGGQPSMECPVCEAYKVGFVDLPPHIESELIEEFGADATNTEAARAARQQKAAEGGYWDKFRLKGRFVEAVNQSAPSRKGP